MTIAVRAVFGVLAYIGVVVAPLAFAAIGASDPGHSFWTNFSVALGFVGLAMMGLEFVLVARFQPVAAPFGQDALLQFHRQLGYVGLAFVFPTWRCRPTGTRSTTSSGRLRWCGSVGLPWSP
jgi:predicted ferric reductase